MIMRVSLETRSYFRARVYFSIMLWARSKSSCTPNTLYHRPSVLHALMSFAKLTLQIQSEWCFGL